MNVIKKVKEKLDQGLFLRYLFDRLTAIGLEITPYYLVQEGLFDETGLDLKRKSTQYASGFLEPSDMKAISSKAEVDYSEKILLDRMANGCRCFGIKHNDDVAAYSWCNLRECDFKWLPFQLKNDEAYLFDARTFKAYRGQNLAPYLRYELYKNLAQMERTKFFSISLLFNTPTIRFKKKLKARPLKLYVFVELFKKYYWNFLLKDYEQ
jgi:hypothetical protein